MKLFFQNEAINSEFNQIKNCITNLEIGYNFSASGCYGFSDQPSQIISLLINNFCNHVKRADDLTELLSVISNYINHEDQSNFFKASVVQQVLIVLLGQANSSFQENLLEFNAYYGQSPANYC